MGRLLLLAVMVAALFSFAAPAQASPYIRYGLQDDAWLVYGPGTLDERIAELDRIGVELVRFTINWHEVEKVRGKRSWGSADSVLEGLREHGIAGVVTLYGSPRWANGGRSPNWAPTSGSSFAAFASAAAKRYPWVKLWLVWNEPNQRRWLRPTTPQTYVTKLLNPAYAAIHRVSRGAKVGGGVTAPRGSTGGVSPVAWIRGMGVAKAHLDAYAHNPYPLRPLETPWAGGCGHCETVTMATLERLQREVAHAFGSSKRIWLTEYGYQTSPPDGSLGVSKTLQARYVGEAAHRAFSARNVDMLIHYLYQDEPDIGRWQSGYVAAGGSVKLSYRAAQLPLAQVSRTGLRTVLWGQVRSGRGPQRYVLQQFRDGGWRSVGGLRQTSARGFLSRTVRAGYGTTFRLWQPSGGIASPLIRVR
ncbi:MAG: hypothetical protein QOF45_866 [Gaiellaceae bacterium]|nr:hypothetical protein [Gaiellaceae bacterium]